VEHMAALVLFNFLIAALTFWLQAHYTEKHISIDYAVLHPEGIVYKKSFLMHKRFLHVEVNQYFRK